MTRKFLIVGLILCLAKPTFSQSYADQRLKLTLYNVGVGGFVGGFGSLLNKKEGERGIEAFWRGFKIGALGGTLVTLGKDLTYQIYDKETLEYAWLARITNAAGSSIIQNAYNHRKWWERWNMNALAFHLEYDVTNKDFKARILVSNFYSAMVFGTQAKLDLGKSLRTGVLFYEKDGLPKGFGLTGSGIGVGTSIAVDKNVGLNDPSEFYSLVAHEAVHTLQYDNLYWVNPFFKRIDGRFKEKSRLYSNLSKYFYLDLNGIALFTIYEIQKSQEWGCRLYEQEAENFSNRVVPPCN